MADDLEPLSPSEALRQLRLAFAKPGRVRPSPVTPLNIDTDEELIRAINAPAMARRTVTELEGMCAAIVHDKKLSDEELSMLRDWVEQKREFIDEWPISELCSILQGILADGIVTEEERAGLMRFLQSISATPELCGQAAESIFDERPCITFKGKSFLFTGKLLLGLRAQAQDMVLSLGGELAKSPTFKLDYLVVGDLGTEMWSHSRYGNKIKSVVDNQRTGAKTRIVKEADFVAACRNAADETLGAAG